MMNKSLIYSVFCVCLVTSASASAETKTETLDECLLHSLQSASESTTVAELRTLCEQRLSNSQSEPVAATEKAARVAADAEGVVEQRFALENYSHDNPFVITPHRPNYLLPVAYSSRPNNTPYSSANIHFQHTEIQFQLSLKVLLMENIIGDNGHLSLAYTEHAFWQSYNRKLSAPFRETNHEPELFFTLENDWEFFGLRNSANQLILNHQSNGQSGNLSRSWNRIMFNSVFEKDNFMFALKPWYKIPESKKDSSTDSGGDDNKDIENYLGNVEILSMYRMKHEQTLSLVVRNNLRSENKGAIELNYAFPIGHSKLKGYLKYFSGYGESLVDYNHRTQTFGIGFLVSDWF